MSTYSVTGFQTEIALIILEITTYFAEQLFKHEIKQKFKLFGSTRAQIAY